MDDQFVIYIISDSLGETARAIVKACLSQFPQHEHWAFKRFSYINNQSLLDQILEEASQSTALLMFSLVDVELASYAQRCCEAQGLVYVDLLTNVLQGMSQLSGLEPLGTPGLLRQLDQDYFDRVAAIEFAVKYDDGKDPRGILQADLVLLGISRTSKTPLSMFLADKAIKVVNIPLVPEVPLPKELDLINPKKMIGLTNSLDRLNQVRKMRLQALGLPGNANYASPERILEEVSYAETVMQQLHCPIINVSDKAIEETATIILDMLKANKLITRDL
ncbi:pyruvate, water dikinase regulatory protein [Streptococcus halichoeri]|uniref:pyruvate, water dikinase regulatory protein n=1 Tax=Streptococcus halichoeri TaxID=254785 RepID=UPI00135C33CB|nr:pyruvate, water dikinase regulatory protein [Streptococcus halichoeri]